MKEIKDDGNRRIVYKEYTGSVYHYNGKEIRHFNWKDLASFETKDECLSFYNLAINSGMYIAD